MMETRLTLMPSQRGTKRFLKQYGEQLLCVRYRYDAEKGKRYKTVELIVDEVDWGSTSSSLSDDSVVLVQVKWGELDLSRKVKQAGGRWNREEQAWELPYGHVKQLDILDRVQMPTEGQGE